MDDARKNTVRTSPRKRGQMTLDGYVEGPQTTPTKASNKKAPPQRRKIAVELKQHEEEQGKEVVHNHKSKGNIDGRLTGTVRASPRKRAQMTTGLGMDDPQTPPSTALGKKTPPKRKKSAAEVQREEQQEENNMRTNGKSNRDHLEGRSKNTAVKASAKKRKQTTADVDLEEEDGDADVESIGDETPVAKRIKMIVSGTCQVCQVSPLFNFLVDSESLKTYGKKIDSALVRHGVEIDPSSTKVFSTKCSYFPFKYIQNEPSSEFMFIEIFKQEGRDSDTRELCFMAMLFGHGTSKVFVRHFNQTKNMKNLPSVAYNGPSKIWKIIKPTLESVFSCNINSVELSPTSVKSIFVTWIFEAIRARLVEKYHQIRFTYIHGLRNNSMGSTMETVFNFKPFLQRWEGFIDNTNLVDAIKGVWKDICQEILVKSKIDISKAVILNVSGKSFSLSSSGRFKIQLEELDMIMVILSQITQSLERVRS